MLPMKLSNSFLNTHYVHLMCDNCSQHSEEFSKLFYPAKYQCVCYREGLIRAHYLDLFSESSSLFGHQTLLPLPLSLPLGQLLQVTFHLQQHPRFLLHVSSLFLHFFLMLVVREVQGGWWSCLFYVCQLWFDRGGDE